MFGTVLGMHVWSSQSIRLGNPYGSVAETPEQGIVGGPQQEQHLEPKEASLLPGLSIIRIHVEK